MQLKHPPLSNPAASFGIDPLWWSELRPMWQNVSFSATSSCLCSHGEGLMRITWNKDKTLQIQANNKAIKQKTKHLISTLIWLFSLEIKWFIWWAINTTKFVFFALESTRWHSYPLLLPDIYSVVVLI